MYKIKVFTIGKLKESWLHEGLAEYSKRLTPYMTIEWILAKNDKELTQLLEKVDTFTCLDPQGTLQTSEEFSLLVQENARLNLVIGGSDGIPAPLKARAKKLLSFSRLTFTHQMMRLILLEQLYRAIEISKGTSYHK